MGGDREPPALSSAEVRILELVEEGLTNAEIAARLFVVEQTVKFHLSRIYKKLGVRNRMEATRWAVRNRAGSLP
ncbi:MAG: helix-turn-helix domain-containing protein [Pseudomonadota bacterium]